MQTIAAAKSRAARSVLTLLGAVLLGFGSLALQACGDRSRVEEATEEMKDELEDAKDEIEDEVDDAT